MDNNTNIDLRLTFSKTGRAKFISHLDLLRSMQRALKRAKIPLWYTQGFNPHSYLMFPLALSLGIESSVELLDFKVTKEVDFDKLLLDLNKQLPEGIRALNVDYPHHKHTEITQSEYKVTLFYDDTECYFNKFNEFIAQEKIEVIKKTKKGEHNIDIKPFVEIISIDKSDKSFSVIMRLPSGVELNLNVSLVMDAFYTFCSQQPNKICVERTKILCDKNEIFD